MNMGAFNKADPVLNVSTFDRDHSKFIIEFFGSFGSGLLAVSGVACESDVPGKDRQSPRRCR